jgi:hypothetical protein
LPPAAENGRLQQTRAAESWGFLTTSYGSMKYTGLPTPNATVTNDLCYGAPQT